MSWTRFFDMHSGGRTKLPPYEYIYIEAPKKEAISVFYSRFKRNPNNVTCHCCGEDYSIREADGLDQATAYERNCLWNDKLKMYLEEDNTYRKRIPLEDYIKNGQCLVVYDKDILPKERYEYLHLNEDSYYE